MLCCMQSPTMEFLVSPQINLCWLNTPSRVRLISEQNIWWERIFWAHLYVPLCKTDTWRVICEKQYLYPWRRYESNDSDFKHAVQYSNTLLRQQVSRLCWYSNSSLRAEFVGGRTKHPWPVLTLPVTCYLLKIHIHINWDAWEKKRWPGRYMSL